MDSENLYYWGPPEKSWILSEEKIAAPQQEYWLFNETRYPGREH